MKGTGDIVIGDGSAGHFLMHGDVAVLVARGAVSGNPLRSCARTAEGLGAFNCENPLYGGRPVSLLVPNRSLRRESKDVTCAVCSPDLPAEAFFQLRGGLYMLTPEGLFLRRATDLSKCRLAELGIELCARYYLDVKTGAIMGRSALLTTPERLGKFLSLCDGHRGVAQAREALAFVLGGSASPMEGKVFLQFCLPLRCGGFNLPFTVMNHDVTVGRSGRIAEQGRYSIDLANPQMKVGIEFDGKAFHEDAGKDKRRRNGLRALGWEVFPLDSSVLYSPTATVTFAEQVAKFLGLRLRYPQSWERNFVKLRHDLDLPT